MKKNTNKEKENQEKSKIKPIHLYKMQKSLQEDGFSVEVHPEKEVPLTISPKKDK